MANKIWYQSSDVFDVKVFCFKFSKLDRRLVVVIFHFKLIWEGK